MSKSDSKFLFLQGLVEVPELNAWIADRLQSKERFTFLEEEVLTPLWQQGEEIRLREDSRFRTVNLSNSHWYLVGQKIANEKLYTALLDETWDGNDLIGYLNQLDAAELLHVFCQDDARFRLTQNGDTFRLDLKEADAYCELTSEQKQYLKELMPTLIATGQLYTTAQILAKLSNQYLSDSIEPTTLASWLMSQPDWARVGLDQWLPRKNLPQIGPLRRYAVKSIGGNALSFQPVIPAYQLGTIENENFEAQSQAKNSPEIESSLPDQISWKVTLRTWHLNEGVLNVPVVARHLYPRARKLSSQVALPGLWYEDGSTLTIWLDKTRHKLFGMDLQEKLDYLGAGVILQVRWSQAGLTFSQVGEDKSVEEEEARLIDLSALAEVRSDKLESYRSSLRLLLATEPQSFISLYEQLCLRQQHTVNKNTVRSILSGSSEFEFDPIKKQWRINSLVSERGGAKTLRRTLLLNQTIDSTNNATQPRGLSELIVSNKQKLVTLRQKLLEKNL